MTINYDRVAEAIYMKLSEGKVAKTIKLDENKLADLDANGMVIGFEILGGSEEFDRLVETLEDNVSTGVPISITEATPATA